MEEMIKKLQTTYPGYKMTEKKFNCLKEEIKRRFTESGEDNWNLDGYLVSEKTRRIYEYDESLFTYLDEERSLLPRAVKIPKHAPTMYPLHNFLYPGEWSVKLSASTKKTDRLKTEQEMRMYADSLMTQKLEDVLSLYKVYQMKHKTEEQKYEQLKKEFITYFLENNTDFAFIPGIGTIRLTEVGREYDVHRIFNELNERFVAFAYKVSGTKANVINLYTGEAFEVDGSLSYQGCNLTLSGGELLAEGHPLSDTVEIHDEHSGETLHLTPLDLKAATKKSFLADGYTIGFGKAPADPDVFFRGCDISATKLKELMDEGILLESEIEAFRRVKSETTFIEIIHEVKNEDRRRAQADNHMARAQTLRHRNETKVTIDNIEDYM